MKPPKSITLKPTEVESLCEKISSNTLSPEEADLLIGVVNTNFWLQYVLMEGKLTIKRLQKLFGVTTEKLQNFKDKVEAAPNLS